MRPDTRGRKDDITIRISRSGSRTSRKGIPATMVARILMFRWSFGPYNRPSWFLGSRGPSLEPPQLRWFDARTQRLQESAVVAEGHLLAMDEEHPLDREFSIFGVLFWGSYMGNPITWVHIW